jgi:hypothetical protein
MSLFGCCGRATNTLATLSRAAAKSAASRLRRLGLLSESVDWARRASACEACPMRVIQRGTSYCGRPLLRQVARQASEEGCGCPCREKARDPQEHCPVDWSHRPARRTIEGCTCKWCNAYAA